MGAFSWRSLRAKLLLLALLLVLVPGTLLTFIAYVDAREALERSAGRQLTELAHDTLDEVAEAVTDARKDLRAWTRQDVMRDLIIGDLDKRVSRFLRSLAAGGAPYLSLLALDRSGHVVAASEPRWLGTAYGDREGARAALGGSEFVGGPAVVPEEGDRRAIETWMPVPDPERPDAVIGALVGRYDWSSAMRVVTRIRRNLLPHGLTVDVLLVDRGGTTIGAAWGEGRTAAEIAALERAGAEVDAGIPPGRAVGYRTAAGAGVLVGWERDDEARGGWRALVMQPLAEALGPVHAMRRRIEVALAIVLLGALVVAGAWASRLAQPLRELTLATQEVTRAGEAPPIVPVRSRDEIGALATAFNAMGAALRHAQEDLLTAAKFAFVGEVAAGVAHEVRTPLGILRSSAQMLARTLPPGQEASAELVDMIVGEVDRIDRVVAGLLEVARPREPLLAPTRLAPLLTRALDFIEGQAREKRITVARSLDAAAPRVLCDPEQIYQVALNLIVNAVQILPPGGHVTVRTVADGRERIGFEVADDGPGIPPELHGRIFTPFFSVREGGTGLGLALVQRMVRGHQGTVTVESAVGHGATFRVLLPAARSQT
jgi:two-component system sensor histidine kinase HydH